MITVCQCNIYDGGRWCGFKRRAATYDTAARFARFIASVCPPVALIGMQEVLAEADAVRIAQYLQGSTGSGWKYARTPQGVNNTSGIAVLWRPDLVEDCEDYGAVILDRLDNGYIIKFAARLFAVAGASLVFGTGKLAWGNALLNGAKITERGRLLEVQRLMAWLDEVSPDNTPRILAMDLNCKPGAPAWQKLNTKYSDPGRRHTHNSFTGTLVMDAIGRRLDYIFISRDFSAQFAAIPRRSPHFGSDHRAVFALIDT